jgi:hypothetical protein
VRRSSAYPRPLSQRRLDESGAGSEARRGNARDAAGGAGTVFRNRPGCCANVKSIWRSNRASGSAICCVISGRRYVRSFYRKLFQQLWDDQSAAWAGQYLDQWCRHTLRSRIAPMKKTHPLREHRQLILNYFRARKLISSGTVGRPEPHGQSHDYAKILRFSYLSGSRIGAVSVTETARAKVNPRFLLTNLRFRERATGTLSRYFAAFLAAGVGVTFFGTACYLRADD